VLRAYEGFKADIALEEDRLYTTYHYEPAHGEYSVNLPGMEVELKDRGWELVGIDSSQATTDGCAKNRLWKIPASINYVIWSDVYVCQGLATIEHFTGKTRQKGKNAGQPIVKKTKVARGCGKPIVLWDAAVNKETGEVSELFRCPHCGQEWQKLLLSFTASVPVQVNYTWKNRMGKSKREQRPVTNDDRRLIEQLENEAIAYWVPHNQVWSRAYDYGAEQKRDQNHSGFLHQAKSPCFGQPLASHRASGAISQTSVALHLHIPSKPSQQITKNETTWPW
jgi:hypothetical protein